MENGHITLAHVGNYFLYVFSVVIEKEEVYSYTHHLHTQTHYLDCKKCIKIRRLLCNSKRFAYLNKNTELVHEMNLDGHSCHSF